MDSAGLTELIKLQRETNELLKRQAKQRKLERTEDKAQFDVQALAIEALTALAALTVVFTYSQWQVIQEKGVVGAIADLTGMGAELKVGDEVAGFTVTSGYGMRKHPITGEMKPLS